jgi:hypothetical protein
MISDLRFALFNPHPYPYPFGEHPGIEVLVTSGPTTVVVRADGPMAARKIIRAWSEHMGREGPVPIDSLPPGYEKFSLLSGEAGSVDEFRFVESVP